VYCSLAFLMNVWGRLLIFGNFVSREVLIQDISERLPEIKGRSRNAFPNFQKGTRQERNQNIPRNAKRTHEFLLCSFFLEIFAVKVQKNNEKSLSASFFVIFTISNSFNSDLIVKYGGILWKRKCWPKFNKHMIVFQYIKFMKRVAKGTQKGTRVPALKRERSRNAFPIS